MPEQETAQPETDQEQADAGLETEAAADEERSEATGDAEDTETEEWTPSWRQRQAANRSGLTDEDVAALVEAWGPEKTAEFLDQRAEQHDSLSRLASQLKSQEAATSSSGRQGLGAETEAEEVPQEEFALLPEHFDRTWENPEAVAEFMKPVVEELNRTRRALRSLLGQVRSLGDRTTAMTADSFFASLDEECREIFGKGPTNVHSDSPEQQARVRVISAAEKIAEGYRRAGTPIHFHEALERALSMEMGDMLKNNARNRRTARAKRRAAQVQAGPKGRRKRRPKTREERKEAFLRDWERTLAR